MPKTYRSSYGRLQGLPAVFTVNTFVRMTGFDRHAAQTVLSRWTARGLLQQAGPRAAIYFNLVVDRRGGDTYWARAVQEAYPSATLAGESVLHAAGWTTQIPAAQALAVQSRRSYVAIHGADIRGRSLAWFRAAFQAGAILRAEDVEFATYGLRTLSPAWALADLYADPSVWHPDPDDLDIPHKAWPAVRHAFQALDLGANESAQRILLEMAAAPTLTAAAQSRPRERPAS
jgi:hypothetical protein